MTNTAYTLRNKVTGEVLTTPDNDGRISSFCIPPMPPYSELYKEDLNEIFNNIELASGLWSCELNKRLQGKQKQTYISQLEVVEVEWKIKESKNIEEVTGAEAKNKGKVCIHDFEYSELLCIYRCHKCGLETESREDEAVEDKELA